MAGVGQQLIKSDAGGARGTAGSFERALAASLALHAMALLAPWGSPMIVAAGSASPAGVMRLSARLVGGQPEPLRADVSPGGTSGGTFALVTDSAPPAAPDANERSLIDDAPSVNAAEATNPPDQPVQREPPPEPSPELAIDEGSIVRAGVIPVVTEYFAASRLTQRPYLIRSPMLETAEILSHPGSGRVVIELRISSHGTIDRVEILSTNAPRDFADHVARAFKVAIYQPGELFGRHVASKLQLEVRLLPPGVAGMRVMTTSVPTPTAKETRRSR